MSLACYRRLVVVLSFLTVFPLINAFTFSFATPSECDDLALTWTGGIAPFQLNLIPVFGTPRNVSIPSSAFNDGKGSFSFSLPLVKKSEVVIAMSDATGFSTGGASNVLTVQPSKGGSCDTNKPVVDFSFQLNTALQQCRPYVFSAYNEAAQPVAIYVIIPGGKPLLLNPPVGPTSFTWDSVNVARSTSLIFMMVDAKGRQGGSSDVKPVGFSDDSSCLDGSSPTSTSNPPSAPTASTSPSDTTSSASASAAPAKGVSIAAVAGTVIGSLLFLAVVITLGLFFLRKRRDAASGGINGDLGRPPPRTGFGNSGYNHPLGPGAPFTGAPLPNNFPPSSPYPYSPRSSVPLGSNPFLDSHDVGHDAASSQHLPPSRGQYQNSPFDASSEYLSSPPSEYQSIRLPPSQFDAASMYAPSRYQDSEVSLHTGRQPSGQLYPPRQYPAPPLDPFSTSGPPMLPGTEFETFSMDSRQDTSPPTSRAPMSTAQRKASQAGSGVQRPTRFIVHTDVEDDLPPPNEDGVVELPPQYTERRGQAGSVNPPVEKAGPPPGTYPL